MELRKLRAEAKGWSLAADDGSRVYGDLYVVDGGNGVVFLTEHQARILTQVTRVEWTREEEDHEADTQDAPAEADEPEGEAL